VQDIYLSMNILQN